MPSVSSIPQEELTEYREIFNLVDDDGSGEIGELSHFSTAVQMLCVVL